MGFISLIVALLLEQVRPLQAGNVVYASLRSLAEIVERNFNAGERQHGLIGWLLVVVPLSLAVLGIYALLTAVQPLLGALWNILILYFTLGFRQFSHHFTEIQLAFAENNIDAARRSLETWKRIDDPDFSASDLDQGGICRVAIEEALVASHRHVFGVFFWFVLLPGPVGAVLYRVADALARKWGRNTGRQAEPFGQVALRAFAWIDWIPVRLTAVGFAVVGNFEDAIFSWRNHARQWLDTHRGIILASGAGAIGVRLGDAGSLAGVRPNSAQHEAALFAPDAPAESVGGVDASPAALRSTVGLVWRSLVLWMILLLLLSVAGLF